MTLGDIASEVQKQSEKIKSPVGAEGKSLNLTLGSLIDQAAIGGTTESVSLFSYRPKKASRTEDTIYYEAVRNKTLTESNTAGETFVADRNLALLEPPSGDTLASDTSYTNFSIRNEFDRMLKARVVSTTESTLPEQQLVANFHQLQSMMILKAPSQGAIVDIYDLQPKFGIGPGTKSNEYYSTDHISPRWCFYNGYSSGLQTDDSYSFKTVGADPMDSTTFRRTYNIFKKTTVRMASNAIHRHRLVFNINKSVTWDEMGQASANGGTAPWLPTQMVVFRGYPTSTSLAEAVQLTIQQESKLSYSSRLANKSKVIVYNNNT
jgi:hypothetical protein